MTSPYKDWLPQDAPLGVAQRPKVAFEFEKTVRFKFSRETLVAGVFVVGILAGFLMAVIRNNHPHLLPRSKP